MDVLLESENEPAAPLASRLLDSYAVRDRLTEAVLADLCGPAGGPQEEVAEAQVRERYLVGMLAPKKQQMALPEENDSLATDEPDAPEEGPTDKGVAQPLTMSPSSFGLTFCVSGEAAGLHITAQWGRYHRVESETLVNQKTNAPLRVWKREPVEGRLTFRPLKEGPIEQFAPYMDQPEVLVQGRMRRHANDWIVTLFLVNGQEEPKRQRDAAWLFQPELSVASPDGKPIFCRRLTALGTNYADPLTQAEQETMTMLYRSVVEFAVGHGVAVHAEPFPDDETVTCRLSTRTVPIYEVPKQTPPAVQDIPALEALTLDMKTLAETKDSGFAARLAALPDAYADWIAAESKRIADPASDLQTHQTAAKDAVKNCVRALERIRAGIDLLAKDPHAAEAFRFANRAMWLQRTRSRYAGEVRRGGKPDMATLDVPKNRTWYPFQLAFILLNLPSVTDLSHPDRSHATQAIADLLWFPTGGGKTEAYLGLSAYTMGLRRLQGTASDHDGENGVAVLMRYTLRLLTLQQFQRATALVCACEVIRRESAAAGEHRWGRVPFRIGLWVGSNTTPNTTDASAEAIKKDKGAYQSSAFGGRGTPEQLTTCPWCGSAINPGVHIQVDPGKSGRGRTVIYCGDPLGGCPFTPRNSPGEGLPAVVVDEEIYRLLPALLIATVDKFAQMPWKGETQMLFGQVNGYCTRHGFRSPEIDDSDTHPARFPLPAARTESRLPLRPPDLIIQDELHLISGPLGTLVGLYETAVDELCTWEAGGRRVRPKVIASTATIRRAAQQVQSLFLRRVEIFPPQGTDIRDNFFSRQRPPDMENAGRRYMGICAPGKRLKVALIRVYVAYLGAAQRLYQENGLSADPYMTLVGYFNSIRELGGMRRLVEDDIRTRLQSAEERGLARRGTPKLEELTSRKGSTDIPRVLDLLEIMFDPATVPKGKGPSGEARPKPLDVLLATNMISVGVDVNRLGLMIASGQPKTTAEYIQATSRVGRSSPGLVCTVYNWARPRDLSHYERFEHYHATFYQHVEALSVTPFSPRALDRGLTSVLVALVRLAAAKYNANGQAMAIQRNDPLVKQAMQAIVARAENVSGSTAVAARVREMLEVRLDAWEKQAQQTSGSKLGYKAARDGVTIGLLRSPEPEPGEPGHGWGHFTCLNSLRDVEPTVGLVMLDGAGMDTPFQAGLLSPTEREGGA